MQCHGMNEKYILNYGVVYPSPYLVPSQSACSLGLDTQQSRNVVQQLSCAVLDLAAEVQLDCD